jgi:hypothetical protein
MQLCFYKIPVYQHRTFRLDLFYPQKDPSALASLDINNHYFNCFDLTRPFSLEEVTRRLTKSFYDGEVFVQRKADNHFFYDPIHGYCTCNAVFNVVSQDSFNYLNHLRLKKNYPRKGIAIRCKCEEVLIFEGSPTVEEVLGCSPTVEEHLNLIPLFYGAYRRKYDPFPSGFQQVLYVKEVDFYQVGSFSHYLVCSLNLMDVKQVSSGV